jgi:hypothetical protein
MPEKGELAGSIGGGEAGSNNGSQGTGSAAILDGQRTSGRREVGFVIAHFHRPRHHGLNLSSRWSDETPGVDKTIARCCNLRC